MSPSPSEPALLVLPIPEPVLTFNVRLGQSNADTVPPECDALYDDVTLLVE